MTEKLTKLSWLEDLYALSQTAATGTELALTQLAMLRHIAEGFSAGGGTLALMTEDGDLSIVTGTDLPREAIGQRIEMGQGIMGRVAQEAKPQLINGTLDASRTSRPAGASTRRTPSSSLCWPLLLKGKVIGVMSMNRYESHEPYGERDLQRGTIMANMLALVIENLRMHQEQALRVEKLSRLNTQLEDMNRQLAEAQAQLLQNEKMASIGQLAAGVAHEINNPIGFVNSNLTTLRRYVENMLSAIDVCEQEIIGLNEATKQKWEAVRSELDLAYVREDAMVLLDQSTDGIRRVRQIVQDLKDFSHVDESVWQTVDIHKGLDSTLNIVNNEIKFVADVSKEYGHLPQVQCLASQLNQVFLNVLVNAAQAINDRRGLIAIRTGQLDDTQVFVEIEDNGCGIPDENLKRIFDPFFTTKPIGKGTGLGLSLTYGIISKHKGHIEVRSKVGVGTAIRIVLPISQDQHCT